MTTRSSVRPRTKSRTLSQAVNRPPPGVSQNRLLAVLPSSDRQRVLQTLSVVPLVLEELLHKPGDPIGHVYFPGSGFLSLVTVLENGRRCYRMPAAAFRAEMDRRGAFYRLLTSYSHALVAASMQSTACNAVHSVEQRLARWLLTAQDRMERDEFPLTQTFAAMMLGTSRRRVTTVAGTLQAAGLITYRRGQVTVLDRTNLESASCEWHQATVAFFEGVFSSLGRRS